MVSKIYPVFIKFLVPVKEIDKFESKLKALDAEYGINQDIIYFSYYAQEKLQEIEYFVKIDIHTGSQKSMEQNIVFISEIFNSPLKSYYPTYSEEPNF